MSKKKAVKKSAKKSPPSRRQKKKPVPPEDDLVWEPIFTDIIIHIDGQSMDSEKKRSISRFLRAEGADVKSRLSEAVELLITDQGNSTKAKEARTLGVEVIDDFSALVASLVPSDNLISAVVDESCRKRWDSVRPWLQATHLELENERIVGQSIGKSRGTAREIRNIQLHKVRLQDCDFARISHWDTYTDCTLTDCTFSDTHISALFQSTLKGCEGAGMTVPGLGRCRIDKSQLTNLVTGAFSGCTISDSILDGVSIGHGYGTANSHFGDFHQTSIVRSKITLDDSNVKFVKCSLEKSQLAGDAEKTRVLEFCDCELMNVDFIGLNADVIVFDNCKLRDCRLIDSAIGMLDLPKTKLENCSLVNSNCETLYATIPQWKKWIGVSKSSLVNLKPLTALKELADTIRDSDVIKLYFDLLTEDQSIVSTYIIRDFLKYLGADGREDVSFEYYKPLEVEKRLCWLLRSLEGVDVDVKSLRRKTSKCPVGPKVLTSQLVAAVHEVAAHRRKFADQHAASRS